MGNSRENEDMGSGSEDSDESEVMVNMEVEGEEDPIESGQHEKTGQDISFMYICNKIILTFQRTFTKKNALQALNDNKWVIVFSLVFLAGLLALGLTIWKGM